MKIVPVPVRQDNYAYLIIDQKSKQAAVVDPFDPIKVIQAAKDEKVELSGTILTTHHHQDHSGGNEEFISIMKDMELNKEIKVYGGSSKILGLTDRVEHGTTFNLNYKNDTNINHPEEEKEKENHSTIKVTCLATPCHTRDSICFYLQNLSNQNHPGVVFTGDTLFVAGCGRFFEGTAEEMDRALNKTLGSLPNETITYVGHEYTKPNAKFAKFIEPNNPDVLQLLDDCESKDGSTIMTTGKYTIGDEKKFNPFMRLEDPNLIKKVMNESTNKPSSVTRTEVMQKLRDLKNSF